MESLRIKTILKEKGITAKVLASRLGISEGALSKNLNGNPTLDKLAGIAAALGVEIGDLFAPSVPVLRCPHCGKPINVELTTGGDD